MSFDEPAGDDRPMAQINMIPLVDVMLVLLVIFIITAPLLTHAVKIDLPRASSQPNVTRVENVQLAIDGAGALFWNGERIERSELRRRFAASAALPAQPEVHIHADRDTRYQRIAEVLSEAARAGLARVGFVTHPEEP